MIERAGSVDVSQPRYFDDLIQRCRIDLFRVSGIDPGCAVSFQSHNIERVWGAAGDFHARRAGEWEFRVFFLLCTETHLEVSVKWADRKRAISRSHLEALRRGAVRFSVELLQEWTAEVDSGEFNDES